MKEAKSDEPKIQGSSYLRGIGWEPFRVFKITITFYFLRGNIVFMYIVPIPYTHLKVFVFIYSISGNDSNNKHNTIC